MRIADLRVRPVSVPTTKSYDISLFKKEGYVEENSRNHLIIEAESDGGEIGYGEVAPAPYWPRGLTGKALAAIIEEAYRPLILGKDPFLLGQIIPLLEAAVVDAPFALGGVDMALYDLAGKALGRPVYDLLGGKVRGSVLVHYSIGIKDPGEVAEEVREAREKGYLDFKVKVGGPDFDREEAAVRAVREHGGEEARIRVDANQGWSAEEAIRCVKALDRYRLVLVEQPVPYWDVEGLARVRKITGVPVLADESCFSPSDVVRIIRLEAADIINIKLMKCGGLWNAAKITNIARAAGLTCFVGGMMEMEIGAAAGFHLMLSREIIRYPSGIFNSFTERPLGRPPWEIRGGRAHLREDIVGLGVDIDSGAISDYSTGA